MKTDGFRDILRSCTLCGHRCKVNRLAGEKGICGALDAIKISSFGPHHGEEPVLTGTFGSGTIFFTGCNLSCVFCQNSDISQTDKGFRLDRAGLAKIMLDLQKKGCHNINWVSPTHMAQLLLESLETARDSGLELPLVYNTGGYDSIETLQMLDGWVDIYMPDAKYGDSAMAMKYSGTPNYWEVNREALKEMHRQAGDLFVENNIAKRGLLVRHLVMPDDISTSMEVLQFIAKEISDNTYINIMDQYRPSYKAVDIYELNRRVTNVEYSTVVMLAESLGLHRGFTNYW